MVYNWSTDTKELKRTPEKYKIWKLEQQINYGLNGEKLKSKELKKYWNKIKIDSKCREVLRFWLFPKSKVSSNG